MDISNRRDSLAMDQWNVVYIPQSRVFEASNRTFLGLLHAENSIEFDPTTEYPVYSSAAELGDGIHYFFSPVASNRFRALLKFWSAVLMEASPDMTLLRRIL